MPRVFGGGGGRVAEYLVNLFVFSSSSVFSHAIMSFECRLVTSVSFCTTTSTFFHLYLRQFVLYAFDLLQSPSQEITFCEIIESL